MSWTPAITPVSLHGQPADFDHKNEVASAHGLPVIEDMAQSFGGSQHGRRSGNLSKISCTSFLPSKPTSCCGDRGAIFTSNDDLSVVLSQIARHGQVRCYYRLRVGVNNPPRQILMQICQLAIRQQQV